jgi:hypothetical protein
MLSRDALRSRADGSTTMYITGWGCQTPHKTPRNHLAAISFSAGCVLALACRGDAERTAATFRRRGS